MHIKSFTIAGFSVALLAGLLSTTATARPTYLRGLPNLASNCGNCHVAPGGGGSRNVFGQDVEANMPVTGPDDATWARIFCADSDGDGKTNGQELGDPCGIWKAGDADPAGDITRPDDEADTTADVGDCDGEAPPTCTLEAGGCGGCAGGGSGALPALGWAGLFAAVLARRSLSRSPRTT